ncbi:hypothetical protein NE237_007164 [Protea cynaroides]|uniref:Uncharacterized protein n=1 Tax=Protea cynaroides TaxID=273540 RepID=A0A9Q0QVV2_9MAGN|nr:hypothetical protein NE237_007164 [Protea cynaroides]
MSSAAIPHFKPLSMAEGCLTSSLTLFTSRMSNPLLSLPSKPTKFQLPSSPSSHPSWLSALSIDSSPSCGPDQHRLLTEQEAGKTDVHEVETRQSTNGKL